MTGSRYRVVWLHSVRAIWLGELVLELSARRETTQPLLDAVDGITEHLAYRPDDIGESRPEGTRVYHDDPLTVTYEVHHDERLVIVIHAHYYVRRPGAPPA